MKQYYTRLTDIANATAAKLRSYDTSHAAALDGLKEALDSQKITLPEYKDEVAALDRRRAEIKAQLGSEIEKLEADFSKYIDEFMAPSSGRMHLDDVEVLKNFTLSSTEFESMAEKYADNPTMQRLLDGYRTEHNVNTNWRLQSAEERKEQFSRVCFGVFHSCDPKYTSDCEKQISALVSDGYHRLQGSDPNEFKIEGASEPPQQEVKYTLF